MALIDDILSPINASLLANLDWLDNAFGKAQRLSKKKDDGRTIHYPGVYIAGTGDDYRSMLPDGHLGNYCYWEIQDPQEYDNIDRAILSHFNFKLVFWFHWPTIFEDYQERSIEELKASVFNVLTASPYTRSVELFTTSESAENIYHRYSHNEVERHFLEYPYGGFSIEGHIYGSVSCNLSMPTPSIPQDLYGRLPANYSTSEQVYPLLKYFGNKVYWRTWLIGDGTDGLVSLTGLTTDLVDDIINVEHVSKNNNDNSKQTLPAILEPVSGTYNIYTSALNGQHRVTVWYTKN